VKGDGHGIVCSWEGFDQIHDAHLLQAHLGLITAGTWEIIACDQIHHGCLAVVMERIQFMMMNLVHSGLGWAQLT